MRLENIESTVDFVSIHVRLTDYHTVLDDLPGISKNYFTRSMTYFSEKYEVYWYSNICDLKDFMIYLPNIEISFMVYYPDVGRE